MNQQNIKERGKKEPTSAPPRREAASFNNSLQVTFDPPPIFAEAKAGVASIAPELRR